MQENIPTILKSVIIMAGGKGPRFGRPDKALVEVKGATLLERLVSQASQFSGNVYVCSSSNSPTVVEACRTREYKFIEEPGNNFVEAVRTCLGSVNKFPSLVLPGDIFLNDTRAIGELIDFYTASPVDLVTLIHDSVPLGISIYRKLPGAGEVLSHENYNCNENMIFNVNTEADYKFLLHQLR